MSTDLAKRLEQSSGAREDTSVKGGKGTRAGVAYRRSGYVDRYNSLKPYCKEAIIILFSEGKIAFNNHKIVLIKKIDYKDFEGAIKDWIKCAFYLGVVFSKTTEDHLSFFLGVDTK